MPCRSAAPPGLPMTMLAHHLVDAGVAKHVLVVGGENRLTGQSRDASIQALAQVGHPDYEVTARADHPRLLRPRRNALHARIRRHAGRPRRIRGADARTHALTHPGAQFHEPITVADVMASKPVATPLKLLDCCPVSDGGAALRGQLRADLAQPASACAAAAQAHTHQHVTAAPALERARRRDRDRQGEGSVRPGDLRRALRRGL